MTIFNMTCELNVCRVKLYMYIIMYVRRCGTCPLLSASTCYNVREGGVSTPLQSPINISYVAHTRTRLT